MPATRPDPEAPGLQPARPLPERVFVTGASGFIGSHVVGRLLDRGVKVRALLLPGDPAPSLAGLPVERVTADLEDPAALERVMAGCGAAIHLAAIYAVWLPRAARMFEVNVGGTRAVMQAARDAGVSRVVHTSSIAAVGVLPGQAVADETTPYADWDAPDPYVLSKYVSELEALKANGPGLEVVAVNPAFPFGANDTAPTPTGRLVLETLRGHFPVITEGGLNAVDVRDVAEGHVLALERGRPGERYILGGQDVTYREMAALVARLTGRRAPRIALPRRVMTTLGWAAERLADHVTHTAPPLSRATAAYTAGRHLYVSSDKARRELGYAPRPLEEAMAEAVAWFAGRL